MQTSSSGSSMSSCRPYKSKHMRNAAKGRNAYAPGQFFLGGRRLLVRCFKYGHSCQEAEVSCCVSGTLKGKSFVLEKVQSLLYNLKLQILTIQTIRTRSYTRPSSLTQSPSVSSKCEGNPGDPQGVRKIYLRTLCSATPEPTACSTTDDFPFC